MKLKKLFLSLMALVAIMLTGCSISNTKKLTFVQTPQAIYYVVGSDDAMNAQKEVLENVIVKVDGMNYTLRTLQELGAQVSGLNLTEEGTHTLVVKYEGATLTYIYKVVTNMGATLFAGGEGKENNPYLISTPEQFINIFTRVYGIAAPAKSSTYDNSNETAWKKYYQASFPFYTTGLHYRLLNDLDFTGVEYKTLGAFGGLNYLPFTGTIDGNNKSIKNVYVRESGDYAALFAGISGSKIYDLKLENITTGYGNKFTAGLVAAALPLIDWDENALGYVSSSLNTLTNISVINSSIAGLDRVGGIVARFAGTTINNSSTDEETVIIGLGQTAGIVGQPIATSKYSYMKLTMEYGNEAIKNKFSPTFIENNTNNASVFTAIAPVNGIYGYNSDVNSSKVTVSGNSDRPNSTNQSTVPTEYDTVEFAIYSTYSPVQGRPATSNRIFFLGNKDEVLGKTTKLPYYDTSTESYITSSVINENIPSEKANSAYAVVGDTLYVNNRYFIYDIDGNETISYYGDISFGVIYKFYFKDSKLISII